MIDLKSCYNIVSVCAAVVGTRQDECAVVVRHSCMLLQMHQTIIESSMLSIKHNTTACPRCAVLLIILLLCPLEKLVFLTVSWRFTGHTHRETLKLLTGRFSIHRSFRFTAVTSRLKGKTYGGVPRDSQSPCLSRRLWRLTSAWHQRRWEGQTCLSCFWIQNVPFTI